MPSKSKPRLSDSWVVDDNEDATNYDDDDDNDEISWAGSANSEAEDVKHQSISRSSPRTTNQASRVSSTSTRSAGHAPNTGPQLIMPSLGTPPPQRGLRQRHTALNNMRRTTSGQTSTPSARAPANTTSLLDHIPIFIKEIIRQALEIGLSALSKLKQPLSWLMAMYMFVGLCSVSYNLFTSSITNALSPICRVPGVSLLNMPICRYSYPSRDTATIAASQDTYTKLGDPEFDALMTIQSKFEAVLDDTSTGITLPMDMKRSETSIRDLRQVVRFSTIPSKNELMHEFDGFVETARIASYDLQKFNSHVGRAVDNVLSTARWTQRVLDDIQVDMASRGAFPAWLNDVLLAPFQPLQFTEARLLDQYITHSRVVSGEIEQLITEATALLLTLTNLEDRLDVIHGISTRDGIAAKSSRDEILSNLWTYLGGNRKELRKTNTQLALLGRVGEYRKLAYAHVAATVVRLQAMGAELEELRSRVGTVEVLKDRGVKGVPLSVHLESIRLGVERLEGQREKAREVERGHIRKAIDAGKKSDEDDKRLLDR